MRIVVAGSRDMPGALTWIVRGFQLCGWVPTTIISGGGGEVDEAAEQYARRNDIPFELYMAEWDDKGPAAGPIRNREMALSGYRLLAIWDGESPGTADMIRQMQRLEKPAYVLEVRLKHYQLGILPP